MLVSAKSRWSSFRLIRQEFARFLVVGSMAALIHWSILWVGVVSLGLEGTISTTLGFSIAIIFSYVLNYFWTFRSEAAHSIAFVKFILVAGCGFFLNAGIFAGVQYGLDTHFLLAQLVATGTVLFWNFSFYRIWSFRA